MREVFIILGVGAVIMGGVTLYRFSRDMKELFTWPVPKKPDPRDEKMHARLARLGPSSPLRDFMILRQADEGGFISGDLRNAVTARPRLEEEVALLLNARKWPDRVLGFEGFDFVPTLSPELAALASSTLREFARALPSSVSHAERDLWAAAHACRILRDGGFHDDAVAHELLLAVRAHYGSRKDLEFIDATVLECLDSSRGTSSTPR